MSDARPALGAPLVFGVFVALGGGILDSLRSRFVPHAAIASKQNAKSS
jgi:hypothetical protein